MWEVCRLVNDYLNNYHMIKWLLLFRRVIQNINLTTFFLPGANPSNLGMSCAPAHMANERFWNSLNQNSPRWSVNATKFGHMDLVDPEFNTWGFYATNNDATEEDFDTFRKFVAGQTVAFISGNIFIILKYFAT